MKATCCCRSRARGVFVSEGFPLALARKLRDLIATVQSDAPLQIASQAASGQVRAAGNDPGLNAVQVLSSAGLVKAGLILARH